MQSLELDYSKLFAGLERRPDSYKFLADHYEWVRREVDQNIKQYHYDDFNTEYLNTLLGGESGKLVVECGCGLGGNTLPHAHRHLCVGIDYSSVALKKLRNYTQVMSVVLGDISMIPLRQGCADFVVLARVLFVHEDLDFIVAILREAKRIVKPTGKIIIINDYSSVGIRVFNPLNKWLVRTVNALRRRESTNEFMVYYFSESDLKWLLGRAGLCLTDSRLCNIHQGIYHLTYHNKILGLMLRDNWRHYRMRRKDHWERVRQSTQINDAYPLSVLGCLIKLLIVKYCPSVAALSLAAVACPVVSGSDVEAATHLAVTVEAPE